MEIELNNEIKCTAKELISDLLHLLPFQEIEVYFKDYGFIASYPSGILSSGDIIEAEVLRYEFVKSDYTLTKDILRIYTDREH